MAKEINTFGHIKAGRLYVVERGQFDNALTAFPDCEVSLLIKRIYPKRSNPANRYYRGVVVPILTKVINAEWGEELDEDEVHELLKRMFNSRIIETSNGKKVKIAISTSKLMQPEFFEYTERCRNWAASFFGVDIPDPVKITSTKTELKV